MAAPGELSEEQRVNLRRAHERLRTASKDLQALVATSPIKNRWEPEAAPAGILSAARLELTQSYSRLHELESEILGWESDGQAIEVRDGDRTLHCSFEDMMRYHGGGSPGGVAHAFKVMERGFPLLDGGAAPQRHDILVTTSFGGPGARDGFEFVTRAVTEGRYVVEPGLARAERGLALERFVFALTYRDRTVMLSLREGFVTDEFIELARSERSPEEEARLTDLKQEMAHRVMASRADDVYDVTPGD
jgi:hypothetical protein